MTSTAGPILPGASPAGNPPSSGRPGPAWPPVTTGFSDTFSDQFSDTFGGPAVVTVIPVLPGTSP